MTDCTEKFCKNYLTAWLDAILTENFDAPNEWYTSSKWTSVHMTNVLFCLAEKLGYRKTDCAEHKNNCPIYEHCEKKKDSCYGVYMQQEYYRVDFTLYNLYQNGYWTLDYAIEHENAKFRLEKDNTIKAKGWFAEFTKLLPLKCAKSRAVICYDDFRDKMDLNKKLSHCLNWLRKSEMQSAIADSQIILIIFPLTHYMKRERYDNGLLRIVEFTKINDVWTMQDNLEEYLCDTKTELLLKEAYKRIISSGKDSLGG